MNLTAGFSGIALCAPLIFATPLMSSSETQDTIIVQHTLGQAPEQLCSNPEGFDVLEVALSFFREASLDELLNLNPAIVCVHAVTQDESANALYAVLQDRYAHFYHLIPEAPLYSQSALFVASQYLISNLGFTPFPAEMTGDASGLFYFMIDATPPAHQDPNFGQIKKEEDSLQSFHKLLALFNALASSKTCSFQTTRNLTTSLENSGLFSVLTHVKPHQLIEPHAKAQEQDATIVLCSEKTDDDSENKKTSGFGYNATGRIDTQGTSSAQVGLDYSKDAKNGRQFSVGVDAKAEQNKKGDKNASIEISVKGTL